MTTSMSGTRPRLRLRLGGEAGKAIRSLGWMGFGQVAVLVLRMGSSLVLTRLLAPEAYGLMGPAVAVATTLEWFTDIGLIAGLVRHPKGGEPNFLMTGWWLGVLRGLAIALITVGLAWPVARFNGEPMLGGILAVLALRPLFNSLRSPGLYVFKRNLDYRRYVIDEVATTAVIVAVNIAVAWATRSYWSLVVGSAVGSLVEIGISYALWPIRPRAIWDRAAVRELSRFGRQAMVNTLMMSLWLNLIGLIGLKFVSTAAMGLFVVASTLASAGEGFVIRGLDVYFSVLARKSGDGLRAGLHGRMLRRFVPLGMPLGALAIVGAPFVLRLLYDRRYEPAGPIFAVMTARLLVYTLGMFQFQDLAVRARMHLTSVAYGTGAAVQLAALAALGPRLGPMGLALASLASALAFTLVQNVLIARDGHPAWRELAITLASAVAGLLVMAAVEGLLPL